MKKDLKFTRQRRLITKSEYETLYKKSFKATQKYLLALYNTNEKSFAKLGVIVSKRVASDAVIRNQIKRIVRESFRYNQDKLKGLNIIIIARQQCGTLSKPKLREGIENLWERLIAQFQHASAK